MTGEFEELFLDDIPNMTVEDADIPEDNHEAFIDAVGEVRNLEFVAEDTRYFGNGIFSVPFYAEFDAELSYLVFKADLYLLDDERLSGLHISDHSDHYYNVSEERLIGIQSEVTFKIKLRSLRERTLTDEEAGQLVKDATLALDGPIELTLADSQSDF